MSICNHGPWDNNVSRVPLAKVTSEKPKIRDVSSFHTSSLSHDLDDAPSEQAVNVWVVIG